MTILRTPQKVTVVGTEVVRQRWSDFGGFSIKIFIKVSLAGLSLAIVDSWPLFRGGC